MRKLSQLMSALVVLVLIGMLTACGLPSGNSAPAAYRTESQLAASAAVSRNYSALPPIASPSATTSGRVSDVRVYQSSPSNVVAAATITAVQPAALPLPEAGVSDGPVFLWRTVGGDPCNPAAGCTLQFGLQRSGWPQEVQQAFLRIVREQGGREVMIGRGWQGWQTWGRYVPRFHPRTRADWQEGRLERALEWSHPFQGVEYVLIKVNRCGNWGGNTRALTPSQTPRPAVPLVACPP